MSNTQSPIQRRLKQVPIDVWSTREKLCLASFVLKSGDQNWSSVSRPLKAFGEPNRPADWFSQKNCALQYSDLLEKVEMPKRKRGERGEETAQDLIVRKLQNERIEELRKLIQSEKDQWHKIRSELELVKNGKVDEAKLKEIWNRKLEEDKVKIQEEINNKKWLQERDAKIAAMRATRGFLTGVVNKPAVKVSTPGVTLNKMIKVESESSVDSPLSVDVDDHTTQAETKTTTAVSGASTSPLLTSLLQSPTPPSSITSVGSLLPVNSIPIKTDTSTLARQSPTATQTNQTQPLFPTTPTSIRTSPSRQISINTTQTTTGVTLVVSDSSESTSLKNQTPVVVTSSSPTLSKLLEMPPSVPGKLPSLPIIEAQMSAQQEQNKSPTKTCVTSKNDKEDNKPDVPQVTVKDDGNKLSEKTKEKDKVEKDNKNASVENKLTQKEVISENKQSKQSFEIKKEEIDSVRQDVSNKVEPSESSSESFKIKQEIMDISETLTNTPNTSSNKKRKRNLSPVNVTATRRSGRVRALRDMKEGSQEENVENKESKESKDTSTTLSTTSSTSTSKKRPSVDETTINDSSLMSEESLDSKTNVISVCESVPNSPASSTMHSEDNSKDPESNREYKIWKKSIMLAYKTASTHKYASIFMHPVTDDEAEGYSDVVYKPMDLNTIKKKIENGNIRTTAEFQRDIMLMFQNAIMYNNHDHDVHKMAVEMQKEILESIEDFIETQQQTNQQTEAKLRSRERRSTMTIVQNTPTQQTTQQSSNNEESGRRKSRGASTDTDSGSSNQMKSTSKKKSSNSKN